MMAYEIVWNGTVDRQRQQAAQRAAPALQPNAPRTYGDSILAIVSAEPGRVWTLKELKRHIPISIDVLRGAVYALGHRGQLKIARGRCGRLLIQGKTRAEAEIAARET